MEALVGALVDALVGAQRARLLSAPSSRLLSAPNWTLLSAPNWALVGAHVRTLLSAPSSTLLSAPMLDALVGLAHARGRSCRGRPVRCSCRTRPCRGRSCRGRPCSMLLSAPSSRLLSSAQAFDAPSSVETAAVAARSAAVVALGPLDPPRRTPVTWASRYRSAFSTPPMAPLSPLVRRKIVAQHQESDTSDHDHCHCTQQSQTLPTHETLLKNCIA